MSGKRAVKTGTRRRHLSGKLHRSADGRFLNWGRQRKGHGRRPKLGPFRVGFMGGLSARKG